MGMRYGNGIWNMEYGILDMAYGYGSTAAVACLWQTFVGVGCWAWQEAKGDRVVAGWRGGVPWFASCGRHYGDAYRWCSVVARAREDVVLCGVVRCGAVRVASGAG
jgi:hypothetical protein